MKVVTLCGSMKFQKQMVEIASSLEAKQGYCVLQPVYLAEGETFSEEEYKNVVEAHFAKINLSDAIYVVNIGGYVGSSTSGEIEYAKTHNKEVLFHETIN